MIDINKTPNKSFSYTSSKGNDIPVTLYGHKEFGDRPILIYIHGFKGFKDWGFVPYMGAYFYDRGFSMLSFNFSHNGIGADPLAFTELDKFERNTHSLELEEAKEVIRLCVHQEVLGNYSRGKIGVLGHSRGGGIAILSAFENEDVAAVATWASVASYDKYDKKTKQNWREKGHREVVNSRTGQVFKMGIDILDDIEKNGKDSLNILAAAKSLEQPILMVHGTEDMVVPSYEAEELSLYASGDNANMRLVPGAGHTFGAKHPFDGTNPQLEHALSLSADFFEEHLT